MYEMFDGLREMALAFSDNRLIYANESAQYYFNSYIYKLTGADISLFFEEESLKRITDKLAGREKFTLPLMLTDSKVKTFTAKYPETGTGRNVCVLIEASDEEDLNENILRASAKPKALFDPLSMGKGEIYSGDLERIFSSASENISVLKKSAVIIRNRTLAYEVEKLSENIELLLNRAQKYIKELSSPGSDIVVTRSIFSLNGMLEKLCLRTENYIKMENLGISLKFSSRNDEIKVSGSYLELLKALAGLLHNSMQYVLASGRKGRISVSIKEEQDDAVIEISDNGIGLSENTFRLINESETDISKLSGEVRQKFLNLKAIASCIQLNEGSIFLSNRKDKGSVATVKLPLLKKSYSSLRSDSFIYNEELEIDKVLREGFIN